MGVSGHRESLLQGLLESGRAHGSSAACLPSGTRSVWVSRALGAACVCLWVSGAYAKVVFFFKWV